MGKKKLNCYMDGNALCIVKEDFINLQESDAVFIELSVEDRKKVMDLEKKKDGE